MVCLARAVVALLCCMSVILRVLHGLPGMHRHGSSNLLVCHAVGAACVSHAGMDLLSWAPYAALVKRKPRLLPTTCSSRPKCALFLGVTCSGSGRVSKLYALPCPLKLTAYAVPLRLAPSFHVYLLQAPRARAPPTI
jgi:hypothetical protein